VVCVFTSGHPDKKINTTTATSTAGAIKGTKHNSEYTWQWPPSNLLAEDL